ncbi:MAG: PAS domain S-box protein [candidate division WOR-3 bacterium]
MPERKKKRSRGLIFKNISIQPGDIIITLDLAGRIVEVNEETHRTLGLSREELLGMPWSGLFPDSGLNVKTVLAGRDFANGFEFIRKDGISMSLYFFATVGLDESGTPAGIVCIGRDVTPFWQPTEKALQVERKYQAVLRLSKDAIVVLSTRGQIQEANAAAAAITGLNMEQLLNQPVDRFIHPEERLTLARFGRRLLRKGSGEITLHILDHQGRERTLQVKAELLPSPTEQLIYALCRDVTAELELRAEVRKHALLVEKLFDAESAAIFLEKMDGTVIRINRAAPRLFRLPESEITGRRLRDIVPADVAVILPQMRTAILDKRQFQAEIYTRRRDGRPLWLLLSNALVELEDETLILTIARDITEEKQALLELRENEARLRLLLNQVPALIWTTDTRLTCTSAIGSGIHSLTTQPGTFVGSRVTAIFGNRPDIDNLLERALQGESVQFEFIQGEQYYLALVEPLRGLDGELLGTVGLAHDVTDYRIIERQLKESLNNYQTLIDIAPITIAVHQQGRIVMINRTGARMLGYDEPAELLGMSVVEFVHPDDWPLAVKRIRTALEKGTSNPPVRERLRRRDGSYILVEVRNAPLTWQGQPAIMVVAQDLSEREKLSRQVQEMLSHTRAILEYSPHGIAAEHEGRIVYANPRFAELFGYELNEVIGKPVVELVAESERERITGYLQARKEGKPAPNEYQFDGLMRDGTIRRLQIKVTTYRINEQLIVLGFVTPADKGPG